MIEEAKKSRALEPFEFTHNKHKLSLIALNDIHYPMIFKLKVRLKSLDLFNFVDATNIFQLFLSEKSPNLQYVAKQKPYLKQTLYINKIRNEILFPMKNVLLGEGGQNKVYLAMRLRADFLKQDFEFDYLAMAKRNLTLTEAQKNIYGKRAADKRMRLIKHTVSELAILKIAQDLENSVPLVDFCFYKAMHQKEKLEKVVCFYPLYQDNLLSIKDEFSREDKNTIAFKICNVVANLHDRKISHGDIKAENILVTIDDKNNTFEIVLGDFGHSYHPLSNFKVQWGGTVGFWAPEKVENFIFNENNPIDPYKVDAWSLGLLLNELLDTPLDWSRHVHSLIQNSSTSSTLREEFDILCVSAECGRLGGNKEVRSLLQIDPDQRATARMMANYFKSQV